METYTFYPMSIIYISSHGLNLYKIVVKNEETKQKNMWNMKKKRRKALSYMGYSGLIIVAGIRGKSTKENHKSTLC